MVQMRGAENAGVHVYAYFFATKQMRHNRFALRVKIKSIYIVLSVNKEIMRLQKLNFINLININLL